MDVNTPQTKNKSRPVSRKPTAAGKGRQLEAPVHTSLPPLVTGAVRGHVRVSVEHGIQWEYSIGPPAPKLCVKLKWWGEKSPGTIFRVPVFTGSSKNKTLGDCTSLAVYQVRSGWPQFKAYIQDMGSLTIQIGLGHMTDQSMVIGQAVLPNLTKLSPTSPITFRPSVTNPKGLHLGRLTITFSMQVLEHRLSGHLSKRSASDHTDPPEFVVGPGVGKFRGRNSLKPTSASTNDREEGEDVLEAREEPPPNSHVHQLSRDVESDGVPEDTSDVSIGPQQLEVISQLIDRGTKLREEMIHSLVDGLPRKNHSPSQEEDQQDDFPTQPLVMAELARGGEGTSTGLPPTDTLHELVCLGTSSGEEEDDIVMGVDDISLTEPDYPLHNKDLLARLLYEDHGEHPTTPLCTDSSKDSGVAMLDNPPQVISVDAQPSQESTADDTLPQASPLHDEHANDFPSSKLSSKLAQEASQSGTTLSSYLGSGERSLESSIVRTLGMEKLTSLGRVSRARVCVESLEVEAGLVDQVLSQRESERNEKKVQMRNLLSLSKKNYTSSTYFVEYQFPAALNGVSKGHTSTRLPAVHEVMRVASKKLVNNAVSFNHQSVFPVSFNSSVVQRWWNSTLIFRVYCKRLTERMPFLVGKAVVPLRTCLTSPSLDVHTRLEVRSSTLTDAVRSHVTDKDPLIGHLQPSTFLQVLIQLVASDKKAPLPKTPTLLTTQPDPPLPDKVEEVQSSTEPAVRLKEPKPLSQTITPTPSLLQLLLLIPEATDVSLSHTEGGLTCGRQVPPQLAVPNCYIVCKLFCAKPHPRTMVQWATHNPQFGFKQVYPLYLTPALLEQVCNNFTVIEVWHRTPGPTNEDELIGLVKVSLHQFYLAFSDQHAEQLYQEAKLPVVTIDSYCPIVNPFSANVCGHLAVLCALGTSDQITHLQQQFACGSYSLHKPYIRPNHHQSNHQQSDSPVPPGKDSLIGHLFHVTIEGVRNLSAFNNTVWGETDCFVQYHFPTQLPDEDTETLMLQPCRTETTLCVPNPSFTHSTEHTLTLAHEVPLQQELVRVCGQGHRGTGRGLNGGVPIELWRRFYYPNIRDQLIAKTLLPIVKLCAMVSMGKGSKSNTQTFSLPLRLVSETENKTTEEGGLLDVTVSYKAVSNSSEMVQLPEVKGDLDKEENVSPDLEEKEELAPTPQDKESADEDTTSQSSTEPSQPADTREQSPVKAEEEKPIPEDAFEARLIIHSALHLQLAEHVLSPGVYVTLHPHPNVDRVCTPVVSCDQKPVWNHHCITHIPNMYLQPQCSGLELQVWNHRSPDSSPPHAAGPQDNLYIGCVYVDLSPLAFGLRQISGWYNIVDFGGQVKGQLKVTVSPASRISYPSRLLSYQLESPPSSFVGKASLLFEKQPPQYPPQSISSQHGLGLGQSEPSVSRTTSMLHQQLRENIQELDDIHKSLQAKLGEIESSVPFRLHSTARSQSTNHHHSISSPPQHMANVTTHTRTALSGYASVHSPPGTTSNHLEQTVVVERITTPPPHTHTIAASVPSIDSMREQHREEHYLEPSNISHSHEAGEESEDGSVSQNSSLSSHRDSRGGGVEAFEQRSDSLTDVSLSSEDTDISQHSTVPNSSSQHSDIDHSDIDTEHVIIPSSLNSTTQPDPSQDHLVSSKEVSDPPPHTEELRQDDVHQPDTVFNTPPTTHSSPPPTPSPPPPNTPSSPTLTTHLPPPPTIRLPPPPTTHLPPPPNTPSPPQLTHLLTTHSEAIPTLPSTLTNPSSDQQQLKSAPTLVHQFGQLPNFFMPPQELEESMRRLRTSALSRPAPRTQPMAHKEGQLRPQGVKSVPALSTLQEVQKYLGSRRVQRQARESSPRMADSNETQRIARIFSSRSSLSSTEN